MISRRSLIKGILSVSLLPLSLFNRQQETRRCYVRTILHWEDADGRRVFVEPGNEIIHCVELKRIGERNTWAPMTENRMMPNVPVFDSLLKAFDYLNPK